MKWIHIAFILMSGFGYSQDQIMIGISNCNCPGNSLDSVRTFVRYLDSSGNKKLDTNFIVSPENCTIEDTTITTYNSEGKALLYLNGKDSIKRSYDTLGRIKTIENSNKHYQSITKYKYYSNNAVPSTSTTDINGEKKSVTEHRKRKSKSYSLDSKSIEKYVYNKNRQLKRLKIITRHEQGGKYVFKMINKFNSGGKIIKSTSYDNGLKQQVTTTEYKEGLDYRETRSFIKENCTIITRYFYE